MGHLLGVVGTALGVFVGTDIDDIVVLTVLFLASRATGVPSGRQIAGGQYLGIAALLAVSAVAAAGLIIVPARWIGLLGLVPLAIGLWGLIRRASATEEAPDAPVTAAGALSVAAVTIANGADNLSVYIPLLRTIGVGDGLLTAAVFAVMIAVWLALGAWLSSHRRIVEAVGRFGGWLVPAVFVAIGVLIVIRSGLLAEAAAAA
jgi:cadmium resistance protein CadD (predicted permease)